MSRADSTRDAASQRRRQLAVNLEAARAEMAAACADAGRDASEVDLVAVTKHFPASDVCHLAALGLTDIGENRDQEAAAKAVAVAEAGVDVRWHFVGRLQRNKCRSVAGYAHLVHSVDRPPLVAALDAAARERRDIPLGVLMQLSLDTAPGRGGVDADGDEELATAILEARGLRLRGVMAVAPLGADPRPAFEDLARRAERVRKLAPEATVVSAGMSGDFAAAIACGATVIRLGTKLLGQRDNLGYPVG